VSEIRVNQNDVQDRIPTLKEKHSPLCKMKCITKIDLGAQFSEAVFVESAGCSFGLVARPYGAYSASSTPSSRSWSSFSPPSASIKSSDHSAKSESCSGVTRSNCERPKPG
ncbi:hypothetical protein PIB30_098679, partial [Stylosanthes scabra]|nr:hypothetical protein [Stylosanthes scabra]